MSEDNKARVSFIAYYAIIWMASSIVGPYQGAFYFSKGFSVLEIGLLSSIGSITSLIMQPIWGIWTDKAKNKMNLLRFIFAGSAALILIYLLGQEYWHFIVITVIYSAFTCSSMTISDVYTLGFINKNHLRFSYIRMSGTLGYAFSVFVLGRILGNAELFIIFIISAVMNIICMAMTFLLPKMDEADYAHQVKSEKQTAGYRQIMTPAIVTIMVFAFVMQIALSYYDTFLGVLVKKMGETETMIGMLQCCSALSEVPVLLIIDKLRQKYSNSAILIFAGFMMAIRMVCGMTASATGMVEMLFVSQLLQGVTYMNLHYCCTMFMSENLPPHLVGTGMALLRVAQGSAGGMVATIGGGYLSDIWGMDVAYAIITVLAFVASVVMLIKYLRDKKMQITAN